VTDSKDPADRGEISVDSRPSNRTEWRPKSRRYTRRTFLETTGSAVVSLGSAPRWAGHPPYERSGDALIEATVARPTTTVMRLGGPIFLKSDDPGELAREHRRLGYRAAYTPAVELKDTDRIKAIVKEFAGQDVVISETGAWRNLQDPDPEKRRVNLAYAQERLALADELGALCCVDIAGSRSSTFWAGPHPDNITQDFIDTTVNNCRNLIDAVKPRRTRFTIEMMPFTFPTGPDEYLRLLRAVDRKSFAVHLDVCNVMNSPERMYKNAAVIRECFDKLGSWIVSCHGKDLVWEDYVQVCLREVVPGRGRIDYKTYLTELSKLPVGAPLMLEHCQTAEEYDEGRRFIQGVARGLGLSFGGEGD
jgi:sugar phosphate isomerase/epimerase